MGVMRANPIPVLVALNLIALAAFATHRWQLKQKVKMRQTITIHDKKRGEVITVVTIATIFALAVGIVIAASHPM